MMDFTAKTARHFSKKTGVSLRLAFVTLDEDKKKKKKGRVPRSRASRPLQQQRHKKSDPSERISPPSPFKKKGIERTRKGEVKEVDE